MDARKGQISCEQVREAVNRAVEPLFVGEDQLDKDLETLGVDSLSYVEAVVELEEAFGILMPEEGMLLANGNTIRKMTALVNQAAEG